MFPNEILLEVISFLNKNDLACLIFANKNINKILCATKTVEFYQNNHGNMLEKSMKSLFIFKTIYYCFEVSPNKEKMLKEASRCGHLEVVKFLAKKGADLTSDDSCAICLASQYGHLEVVKFLVANGANLKDYDAFCAASQYGHLEVVKFLVANGADLTANNNFALRWASTCGHLEVVKFLVENGADITTNSNHAIRYARKYGHLEIVKYLIANST